MGLTIDTSILVDFFTKKYVERYKKSEKLLKAAKGKAVYCPKLILAEITSVLVRYDAKLADLGYNFTLKNFNLTREDEIFDVLLEICKSTGCRAIDSYFIATAKVTSSILITNDRIMANNARQYGVEAYYLIEELVV